MNRSIFAGAAMLTALAAMGSAALAAGPRPSSENNWPGMTTGTVATAPTGAPHYVYQQGYDRHGKWRAHWVLVQ